MAQELGNRIELIKMFLSPEERIIRLCMEKGDMFYNTGEHRKANKYFARILALSSEESYDYKIAKSRMTNV